MVEEEIVKEKAKPAKSEPTDEVSNVTDESPAAVEEKEPASEVNSC